MTGMATTQVDGRGEGGTVHRHRLSTRVWHWVNVLVFVVMLMSGLMIFNAHPRLYWGEYGANPDPAWLEIGADGGRGFLQLGSVRIDTTGVLGVSEHSGRVQQRAFPAWATIPAGYDLALARRWHLSFAWLFAGGAALYLLSPLAGAVTGDGCSCRVAAAHAVNAAARRGAGTAEIDILDRCFGATEAGRGPEDQLLVEL